MIYVIYLDFEKKFLFNKEGNMETLTFLEITKEIYNYNFLFARKKRSVKILNFNFCNSNIKNFKKNENNLN